MSSCQFRYPYDFNPMFISPKHVHLNFGGLSASFCVDATNIVVLWFLLPSMMKKLYLLYIYLFQYWMLDGLHNSLFGGCRVGCVPLVYIGYH